MRMKYIYEEYETHWWRRFTKAEYEAEKKTRLNKGVGFFKTFDTGTKSVPSRTVSRPMVLVEHQYDLEQKKGGGSSPLAIYLHSKPGSISSL